MQPIINLFSSLFICFLINKGIIKLSYVPVNHSAIDFPFLTKAQFNVLRIFVRRSINKESTKSKDIAEEVFTSKNTVRNHLNNIRYKAGIDSRAGLIGWAIRNQIYEVNIPGVKQ